MSGKKSNQGGPSIRSANVFNSIRAEDDRSLVMLLFFLTGAAGWHQNSVLVELQRNSEVPVLFDIKA